MTLLTVEKYSGISADRSHHRRKPMSHALWEKLNEQSIELNGYWWSAYLPLTGHNNDPYMTYLPLTQFSNRPANWGTRGVGAQFETECSENRTSIPRIFVQINTFPFSVKGDWPDELLYSQVRTSLCTRRTGMATRKIDHSLKPFYSRYALKLIVPSISTMIRWFCWLVTVVIC